MFLSWFNTFPQGDGFKISDFKAASTFNEYLGRPARFHNPNERGNRRCGKEEGIFEKRNQGLRVLVFLDQGMWVTLGPAKE
jgi:hypothetical protein